MNRPGKIIKASTIDDVFFLDENPTETIIRKLLNNQIFFTSKEFARESKTSLTGVKQKLERFDWLDSKLLKSKENGRFGWVYYLKVKK